MDKHLLSDALAFSLPLTLIIVGLLKSHTGTDLILVGATFYLANQLEKLTD